MDPEFGTPARLPSLSVEPPSSPPLGPELNNVASLPVLAAQTHSSTLEVSDSMSSDPLFSEDVSSFGGTGSDEPPGGDETIKRKRVVRAPWFDLTPAKPPKRPRNQLSRFVDSGVYMASDTSDEGHWHEGGDVETPVRLPKSLSRRQNVDTPLRAASQMSPSLRQAYDTINACIDQCLPRVDLSALDLKTIPGALIKSLDQLILSKTLDNQPGQSSSLVAGLQIYLSNNSLTHLPPELWGLANTEVLSLRNNELTELPHCIRKLHQLKELNIASNQIEVLPWSLLGMLSDTANPLMLTADPNPLRNPTSLADVHPELRSRDTRTNVVGGRISQKDYDWLIRSMISGRVEEAWKEHIKQHPATLPSPLYGATSAITFLDVYGNRIDEQKASAIRSRSVPNVPSLFELALRTIARAEKQHINDVYMHSLTPAVRSGVAKAIEANLADNQPPCSVCGCTYVVPRAEWIEHWYIPRPGQEPNPNHTMKYPTLPFCRQACSVTCAIQRQQEILQTTEPAPDYMNVNQVVAS